MKYRFRFYKKEIPLEIICYADSLEELGEESFNDFYLENLEEDWLKNSYGDTKLIHFSEIEKLLPKEYWREGMYLFSHLKLESANNKKREEKQGMFGYSDYTAMVFYRGRWYSCSYTEDERERLNLSQPGQKEWEFILSIPEQYLNEYYKLYRNYWYWYHEFHSSRRESILYNYKFWRKAKNELERAIKLQQKLKK